MLSHCYFFVKQQERARRFFTGNSSSIDCPVPTEPELVVVSAGIVRLSYGVPGFVEDRRLPAENLAQRGRGAGLYPWGGL